MFIKRKAYTLIELMIALTIFAVVAVICVNALVTSMASARRIQAQVYLYTEAQTLMDQLAREVERNTVDYEAYYLRYGYKSPETGWATGNYGYYGQSFYNPGFGDPSPTEGPYTAIEGYGVLCSDGVNYYPDSCPTETPNYDYLDLNTGAHPFSEIDDFGYTDDPSYMNAFCETSSSGVDCTAWTEIVMNELILINGAGDERIVFVQEQFDSSSTEYFLSKAKLVGTDGDYDGIPETWVCSDDYSCDGVTGGPDVDDLTDSDDPADDFMSISPSRLNVSEFMIYISPFEDPYRAFAEEDSQTQPQVTIVLTVTLSDEYGNRLLGDVPSITLQRTISTGVYSEVTSYE